jgi:FixJ family two-component response regulator
MNDLVGVLEEHDAGRDAVADLLRRYGHAVAGFRSAACFLDEVREGLDPACLVADLVLSDMSGPEFLERMAGLGLSFPVIFLARRGDVAGAVQAMKAGAADVQTRPLCEEALVRSVDEALAARRRESSASAWKRTARSLLAGLTPREREVFGRVVRGKANKQTARELGITERTVKAHRQRIFQKLRAATVADLVSMAEGLGMISHEPTPGAPTAQARPEWNG